MAKSKSKTQETVLLIRISDVEARHGEASLTIQRGDLGHLQQFNYSGLTLRGNIAEAVQTALVALAKLEADPPPKFNTPATSAQADNPDTTATPLDENDAEPADDSDTEGGDEAEEGEDPSDTDADEVDAAPPVVNSISEAAPASEPSERITNAPQTTEDALSANTAQMSLF